MLCPNCNAPINENSKFCSACGAPVPVEPVAVNPVVEEAPVVEVAPVAEPVVPVVEPAPVYVAPVCNTQPQITAEDLPEQYRPLSAWAYFGLQLLYAIPIVGLVFLIVFSFSRGNLNRRSFTRSYWCMYLILLIVAAVVTVIAGGLGAILGTRY